MTSVNPLSAVSLSRSSSSFGLSLVSTGSGTSPPGTLGRAMSYTISWWTRHHPETRTLDPLPRCPQERKGVRRRKGSSSGSNWVHPKGSSTSWGPDTFPGRLSRPYLTSRYLTQPPTGVGEVRSSIVYTSSPLKFPSLLSSLRSRRRVLGVGDVSLPGVRRPSDTSTVSSRRGVAYLRDESGAWSERGDGRPRNSVLSVQKETRR